MAAKLWYRTPTAGDLFDLCRAMSSADAHEVFALRAHEDRERLAAELYAMLPYSPLALCFGLDTSPAAIAFLGLWPMDDTGALLTAHAFGTDRFALVAHQLARFARRIAIPHLMDMGATRAECRVLATHLPARAFIRACGGREEAPLTDMGRGRETYILCSWTKTAFETSGKARHVRRHPARQSGG